MKKIIATKAILNERIDKFLAREFFSPRKTMSRGKYTRGEIIRNIKSGDILVNNKRIKPSYILKEGDEIISNFKVQISKKLFPNSNLKIKIIYQDKNIIVLDKPAGISVHPSTSSGQVPEKNTLVNFLLVKFPEIKNVGDGSPGSELRPGIVHRLDKDTSGIMVVARTQAAFDELKKLFQNHEVRKEYLAVIFGKLKNKKGLIEKPIARSADYKKQIISNAKTKTKIRPAVTEYEVVKEYKNYSLIKAMPKTGRMHQIRVHLASLDHPIVGDKKYAHKNTKNPPGVMRQLLHAQNLEFELFGEKYSFESLLPVDFSRFIKSLDWNGIKS